MRPFSTWSEPAIRSAAVQAAERVLDLMADFGALPPVTPTRAGAEVYCEELHGLLEALARQERRIQKLFDELRLREHWRDLGSR